MAKKDRNDAATAEASNGDQPSAISRSDVAPAEAQADNVIEMESFINRADRADWLSVADAAKYLIDVHGATGIDAQKMRNAANNRKEFKAAGAMLKVVIPGYEIRPLTYLHREAVDAYDAANKSGDVPRIGRTTAAGKRWIIRIKPELLADVTTALQAYGIALETASAPHKTASADASAEAPAVDMFAADAASNGDASNGDASNGDAAPPVDMQRTEEFEAAQV